MGQSLLPLKPGQYLDVFPLLKLKLKRSPELQCQQDTPGKAEPLLQNEQGADCLSLCCSDVTARRKKIFFIQQQTPPCPSLHLIVQKHSPASLH